VLGAMAIVIAILIVLNAQDKKTKPTPAPTVTNTITQTTPFGQGPTAMPAPDWPDAGAIGHGGEEFGVSRLDALASPAMVQVMPPAPEQTLE
jgi:hypothetical protein